MPRIEKGSTKVDIVWPPKGKTFTVNEVFKSNFIDGKPKVSSVTVQTRIRDLVNRGDVVTFGEQGTKGRPKMLYKFIIDPPNSQKTNAQLTPSSLINQSL